MGTALRMPGKNLEIIVKEFNIDNPSSTLYYEPVVDVSLNGYIPISCGFSTHSISTKCYQCRLISATQVKMGFCVGDGSQGNLQAGTVGTLNVTYIKK